jgi:hypothetical protein
MPLENARFLCQSLPEVPWPLKAAVNVVIADERAFDCPENVTNGNTSYQPPE